ncbi:MAG TPA: crossover junction endodeoxyribonuclease RuvC [Candidatus Moranbacteria bacterium]|nr:crossover junction endodeoxyribonuclease RuvC [Candidatus Moranbacteria bacterium]
MIKTSREVVILGLDPGTAMTGWGIIKETEKGTETVAFGCIETDKSKDAVARLKEIARDLKSLIEKYKPDEVAVEDLFFFKNLKTAIKVAQARGVLLVTSANANLPVFEYTPLQVKQALTGYGRAEKQQVQWMVKEILKLKKIPKPDDAADALAVAVCHQQSRKMINL